MTDFDNNVFINCPFDPEYRQLLITLIFTVRYLGLNPRLSLERSNSAEIRIDNILEIIKSSKYGVHDLSRITSTAVNEHFRMNMPFELGIDYGCKKLKGGKWKEKNLLVLEKEKYRYQAALSDFSGSDIRNHDNDPMTLVREVRDWFVIGTSVAGDSFRTIWYRFNDFIADLEIELERRGYTNEDYENVPIPEVMVYMTSWLDENT